MLADDIEMLMCHCRNSLSANGELLGAMTRIKNFVDEAQKTPTNIARDEILLCVADRSCCFKKAYCSVELGSCIEQRKTSPVA